MHNMHMHVYMCMHTCTYGLYGMYGRFWPIERTANPLGHKIEIKTAITLLGNQIENYSRPAWETRTFCPAHFAPHTTSGAAGAAAL